jgi:lysyl-tRNA synthetase class 2
MSLAPKTNRLDVNWSFGEPKKVRLRAKVIQNCRDFLLNLGLLEVNTPPLAPIWSKDPHIELIQANNGWALQPSPEHHLKALLAEGFGDLFEITTVFRAHESGSRHLIQFSLLEWYRVGFTMNQLMAEVSDLMTLLGTKQPTQTTYAELWQTLNISPFEPDITRWQSLAQAHRLDYNSANFKLSDYPDFIFSHLIQPHLGHSAPLFVSYFPAFQTPLAKTLPSPNNHLALRFELYYKGLELANGYEELTDLDMHLQQDPNLQANSPILYHALQKGLPQASGVAVGLDRLCMALTDSLEIQSVCALSYGQE